jgi:hypothetical protein
LEPGHPASDYSCPQCKFWYQLKGERDRPGRRSERLVTNIFFDSAFGGTPTAARETHALPVIKEKPELFSADFAD